MREPIHNGADLLYGGFQSLERGNAAEHTIHAVRDTAGSGALTARVLGSDVDVSMTTNPAPGSSAGAPEEVHA